jgi:hypothetical protein
MMKRHYIGCKQIEACERSYPGDDLSMRGLPGYEIVYPDGYTSWSPKGVFEKAYLPMGTKPSPIPDDEVTLNTNSVTQKMVDDFIVSHEVKTVGLKTTVVQATLRNGFEIVESSSCVDPANYSEELGANICKERIKNQVWHLLGFALQWARAGLK